MSYWWSVFPRPSDSYDLCMLASIFPVDCLCRRQNRMQALISFRFKPACMQGARSFWYLPLILSLRVTATLESLCRNLVLWIRRFGTACRRDHLRLPWRAISDHQLTTCRFLKFIIWKVCLVNSIILICGYRWCQRQFCWPFLWNWYSNRFDANAHNMAIRKTSIVCLCGSLQIYLRYISIIRNGHRADRENSTLIAHSIIYIFVYLNLKTLLHRSIWQHLKPLNCACRQNATIVMNRTRAFDFLLMWHSHTAAEAFYTLSQSTIDRSLANINVDPNSHLQLIHLCCRN